MAAYDLVIVGGGVQGLWIARQAIRAGLKTALVEAKVCGAGASGGMLGALMPHVPTGWSEKKQFQFDALSGLEAEAAALCDETGIDPGYVRCGRAMPIRAKGFLDQFESRRAASALRWQRDNGQSFELALLEAEALEGWLDPEQAALGVFWDPMAARVNPQSYIAALKASVSGPCDIRENWRFASFDAAAGKLTNIDGETLATAQVVIAAGYESFTLVREMTGFVMGGGVKGQSALLAAQLPANRPILYDDGMYIVAHSAFQCAVGSTSEKVWDDPVSTDEQIEARVAQAQRLCPPLRGAKVIATWAGVRPQSAARDPIVGRLGYDSPIYVASGGFKITFGIAHLVAERLVEGIVRGEAPLGLPQSFAPDGHFAAARAFGVTEAS